MNILLIGGNRFFGKSLAGLIEDSAHKLFVMNRGKLNCEYGEQTKHIVGDRNDEQFLLKTINDCSIDLVFDQVCFDLAQANISVNVLEKAENQDIKYVFTSTQSVYSSGIALQETDFDPYTYQYQKQIDADEDYGEAKRQAESGFFTSSKKGSIAAIRFPIVMGSDDYTKRFLFHIEALKDQKEIFFPNTDASISFIHSDDAALALFAYIDNFVCGPMNVCAAKPIKLINLLHILEDEYSMKFRFGEDPQKNYSPYGIASDWWMDTEKFQKFGLSLKEIQSFVPELIKELT